MMTLSCFSFLISSQTPRLLTGSSPVVYLRIFQELDEQQGKRREGEKETGSSKKMILGLAMLLMATDNLRFIPPLNEETRLWAT